MNKLKEKIYNILKGIKSNKRIMWLSIISVLVLFTAALNTTFSLISKTTNKNHANITIGKLKYNMQVNNGELEDRILRITKNDADIFHINLTALNKYNTNYELIYNVCKNEKCDEYIEKPNDLDILVSSKTINNINGEIKSQESISITIAGINTNEKEDYYIKLDLNAGYIHNELALKRQITHTYYEDDVTIIAIVDGEEVSHFPTTGNYGVLYECMVGTNPDNNVVVTGTWDTSDENNYHWKLTVNNITKPRTVCNVTFAAKSLSRIAITKNPDQMYYAPEEAFNSSGMILTGYFDEGGEEASVELSGYTVSPNIINIGDTKLTITYKDGEVPFTTQLNVNIKPKLTVDFNGGTGTDVSGYYMPGETISLGVATKSGTTFVGWEVLSGDVAINDNTLIINTFDVSVKALYQQTWSFAYTGNEQSLITPYSGVYKLETWGAQGGGTNGGFGGYSSGYINLQKGIPLFINVGGFSTTMTGGYNGGGSGNSGNNIPGYGGGGATHIALSGGKLNNLQYSTDKIIIVAGGGGGGISWNNLAGGCGGGATGCNAYSHSSVFKISAGTQTSGYAFGLGQTITSIPSDASWGNEGRGGGGGGYYGGYGQTSGGDHSNSGGAGGSGYIGNSSLYSKVMYCSNCGNNSSTNSYTVSTSCASNSPTENCTKKGSGYAKITFISTT